MTRMPLPREFFLRDPVAVAPDLLGCRLVVDQVELLITEVEAYCGVKDPGSHAYRGCTPRNAAMFGPPGHAYVYFTYGMHHCMNVVCCPDGIAGAVLLRAGKILFGDDLVQQRRPSICVRDWARGPGRLTKALAIGQADNGADLCDGTRMQILAREAIPLVVDQGPRVGVSGIGGSDEYPWRYWLVGESTVSAYRHA